MKGQISYIEPIFTLLLAGILAGVVAVMLPGQKLEVTPDIDNKEFENRAIFLANSLLAEPNLIYSNGDVYYRGIFDKQKLDTSIFPKETLSRLDNLVSCSSLCGTRRSYPDSFGVIVINVTDNNDGWLTFLYPSNNNIELLNKMISCISGFNKDNIPKLFTGISSEVFELRECGFKSTIVFSDGIPVAIRYSDTETHMGLLKIVVVE